MSLETGTAPKTEGNVQQAVPFFGVTDIKSSLRFYVEGLGFQLKHQWIDEGRLRWCWLQLGGAALMLQEFRRERIPAEKLGVGVSVCFMCKDALELYQEFRSRGIDASEPCVGNHLWVTCVRDPDGWKLDFESPTDVPEDTKLSEWQR